MLDDLNLINVKKSIVYMAHYSRASHIGSCLSIADILYTLYFKILNIDPCDPDNPNRDKLILSKAHSSAALYSVLAERGFFSKMYLDKYFIDGGILPGHLQKGTIPGIETSGGSLGLGLSIGVGMAIANKLTNNPGKIYVVLSDGECEEGSVWEAVMLASTKKLDNITAIIDFNKLQASGKTNEIINQTNMADRWQAFGWDPIEVNGHNIDELEHAFKKAQFRPKVIVAHTIKGKGISFMEDKIEWHHRSLNDDEYKKAINELESGDELYPSKNKKAEEVV